MKLRIAKKVAIGPRFARYRMSTLHAALMRLGHERMRWWFVARVSKEIREGCGAREVRLPGKLMTLILTFKR